MKQLAALLALLLLYTCVSYGQASDNRSLLWRISGKHMSKPSFLFGTIHLICPDDYVWTEKMNESLEKSETVCFEMNLDDPMVLMQAAAGFIDNSGKMLKDYFTPPQYTALSDYLRDSLNMAISTLQQIKPIALETLFATKDLSCPSPVSYEEKIMAVAKTEKKTIAGLEEASEQIEVLQSIPTDTVIKEILDIINEKGDVKGREEYQKLVSAYKQQDLPALYALMKRYKEPGEDMGAFLDERNKKWIDRMVDKMEQHSVFFAVGAGHLWGQNGVISLLRKAGYAVEPVK